VDENKSVLASAFRKVRDVLFGASIMTPTKLLTKENDNDTLVLRRKGIRFAGSKTHYVEEGVSNKTLCGDKIYSKDVPVRLVVDGAVLVVDCKKCCSAVKGAKFVKIARQNLVVSNASN
jgi:hypothetical protein